MVDRIITAEVEEKVVTFGALSYPNSKMANVLGWKLEEVNELMSNQKSDYFILYERGVDMAEYLLDKKLFDMAKSGDLKAMEKYDFKKQQAMSLGKQKGKVGR